MEFGAREGGTGWTRGQLLRGAVGAGAAVALGGAGYSVYRLAQDGDNTDWAAVGATAPGAPGTTVSSFASRPDLRPPTVDVVRRKDEVAPGYLFIAPSSGPGQRGVLMLDDHGRVVWFHPTVPRTAMNFRAAFYKGQPVLTWWEGKSEHGLAVGDALGAPYEGLTSPDIFFRFGEPAVIVTNPTGDTLYYTDDTEMMIGVAETLAECGTIDEDRLARAFAENYHPERGYGRGARQIIERMQRGKDWRTLAGTIFPGGSFGNGAAMRVAPVGLLFADNLDEVWRQAAASALPVTQGDARVDTLLALVQRAIRFRRQDRVVYEAIANSNDIADDLENGTQNTRYEYGSPAFLGLGLTGTGTRVAGVYAGTPAARAGISAGDSVTRIGTTQVRTAKQLRDAVQAYAPGDRVRIAWTDADGTPHIASVTLMAGPIA